MADADRERLTALIFVTSLAGGSLKKIFAVERKKWTEVLNNV